MYIDTTQIGSLFTLFLHAPLKAFTFICEVPDLTSEIWGKCFTILSKLETVALDHLEGAASANVGMF
jgi:hypothetical protein